MFGTTEPAKEPKSLFEPKPLFDNQANASKANTNNSGMFNFGSQQSVFNPPTPVCILSLFLYTVRFHMLVTFLDAFFDV